MGLDALPLLFGAVILKDQNLQTLLYALILLIALILSDG
jgi:hypothetical protein